MIIEKNESARPVCIFGKLYGNASETIDMLRKVCNVTDNGSSVKIWVNSKKHQHNVFYVSKEFYEAMKDSTGCITREMYNTWSV